MNKFEAERRFAQRMKDNYPPGTRIMLLQMGDDPRPVEPNTRGTVAVVDDPQPKTEPNNGGPDMTERQPKVPATVRTG